MRPSALLSVRSISSVFTLAVLTACGAPSPQTPGGRSEVQSVRSTLTFTDWCAQWGLSGCPTSAPDVPQNGKPWSATQWRAILGMSRSVLQGQSRLVVTRTQMQDSNLSNAMRLLGVEHIRRAMLARMERQKVDSLEIGGGRARLKASAETETDAESGLHVSTANQLDVSVDGMSVRVSGLRIGSRDGSLVDDVGMFTVTNQNVASLSTSRDEVTGVPLSFVGSDILLFEGGGNRSPGKVTAERIIAALPPLKSWLLQGQRDLHLGSLELDAASRVVGAFSTNPSSRQTVQTLLGAISSLQSTASSRASALFKGTLRRQVRCVDSEGKAEIILKNLFGLKDVRPLGGSTVALEPFGISITAKVGPFKRTFEPLRMDVSPTQLKLYNVPVVGTHTIDLNQQNNGMRCS